MASSKQPPQQPPPAGPQPGATPSVRPAGAVSPPPPAMPPAPSSTAAHAADLERQIRRRSWLAALGIALALAAAGVALYFALDTRDNSVKKDELQGLTPATEASGSIAPIELAIIDARARAAFAS